MVERMAGRRDSAPDAPAPAARRVERPPRSRRAALRSAGLAAGLLLAVGATAAVLLTDDARYLRIGLLAACWAFLVAAFLAGGRGDDQVAAQGREAELRHDYELELQREVTARQEYELDLADRLRREAEQGTQQELGRLRGEVASLSGLRGDVAALAGLRGELAGLGRLRAELAGLAQLRAELGELRTELAEQLSGELHIERMVMRAQSVRVPLDRGEDDRTGEGHLRDDRRRDDPVRDDRRTDVRVFDSRTVDGDGRTGVWAAGTGGRRLPTAAPVPVPPPPAAPVATPPEPPVRWPADRSPGERVDGTPPGHPSGPPRPSVPPSRHRVGPDADARTASPAHRHRRAAEPAPPPAAASWSVAASAPVTDDASPVPAPPEDAGHARLAEILAESGVRTDPGSRRRRRYRDEDERSADDVLARVLGRE
jgi:hypothetical protein